MPLSFPYWETHLEGVVHVSDGIKAKCPAHDDTRASLHVTRADDGATLVHCFAGCTYQDIVAAVSGEHVPLPRRVKKVVRTNGHVQHASPLEWLADYTNVPLGFLKELPLAEHNGKVVFLFVDTREGALPFLSLPRKLRVPGEKTFSWDPAGASVPPLWPLPLGTLEETITITEGETDCIVLRFMREIGAYEFDSYALTRGASGIKNARAVFRELWWMGVRRVILALDEDAAGQAATEELTDVATSAGLQVAYTDFKPEVLIGEKDLRDWYSRTKGFSDLQIRLDTYAEPFDILSQQHVETDWIIPGYLARDSLTLIAGYPKAGKSTLLMYLVGCLEHGRPFLGIPTQRARALIMSEEEPFQVIEKAIRYDASKFALLTKRGANARSLTFMQALAGSVQQAQLEGYTVLILDTLTAWAEFEDENAASEVTKLLNQVRSITTGSGLAIILVHHMRKGGGENGEGIRGSSALYALVDIAMEYRAKSKDVRVLDVTSRFQDVPDQAHVRKEPDGTIGYVDGAEYDIEEAKPIIDALGGNDLTVKEIAQASGMTEWQVRRHVYRLVELGKVEEYAGPRNSKKYRLLDGSEGGSTFRVKFTRKK